MLIWPTSYRPVLYATSAIALRTFIDVIADLYIIIVTDVMFLMNIRFLCFFSLAWNASHVAMSNVAALIF